MNVREAYEINMVKKFVTKETYEKVFKRDKGRCRLCGTTQTLQLHHIHGRGLNLTNNVNNCIMLCMHCHLDVVHKNLKKYRPILDKIVKGEKNGGKNNYMF